MKTFGEFAEAFAILAALIAVSGIMASGIVHLIVALKP